MEKTEIDNEYTYIHRWLRLNHGKADRCQSKDCTNKNSKYDYALIKGKTHDYIRENYVMLCKSCHSKYDFNEEKRHRLRMINLGRPPTTCRSVAQVDDFGQIVDEFSSITAASEKTGISITSIANNLANRSKKSGGFAWEYKIAKHIKSTVLIHNIIGDHGSGDNRKFMADLMRLRKQVAKESMDVINNAHDFLKLKYV